MPSSRGWESYADRIPEMAPSTKREGGSPAKTQKILLIDFILLTKKCRAFVFCIFIQ